MGARLFVAALAIASVAGAVGCRSCSKSNHGETDAAKARADDAQASDASVMNDTPVPTASVAKAVNPDGLPAYEGPTGSIEGTVSVTGDPPKPVEADFSKCPDAAKTWGTNFREGPETHPAGAKGTAHALADAIVAVTGYTGFFVPEKDASETLRIEGCAFARRTVTMTFGQRLEVDNDSKEFWIPLLQPGSTKVMMMAPPGGDPVKIYPKKPGHYLLLDRDRAYAFANVYVFMHPLHTSTDLRGHYRIDGVPVGKVKVSTTHPRFDGEDSEEVEVRPGVIAKVDLVLHHVARDAAPPKRDASATGTRLR